MQYNNQGIHPNDILVGLQVSSDLMDQLINEMLIIVCSDGIKVRRCKAVKIETLTLAADNPSFEDEQVPIKDILQLWKVIGKYTTQLNPPTRLEERVSKIESMIDRLVDKLG